MKSEAEVWEGARQETRRRACHPHPRPAILTLPPVGPRRLHHTSTTATPLSVSIPTTYIYLNLTVIYHYLP